MGLGTAPRSRGDMGDLKQLAGRRSFRWPGTAREMIKAYLNTVSFEVLGQDGHNTQMALTALITRIAAVSGNPRGACWRFARQLGITSKRSYRPWDKGRATEASGLDRFPYLVGQEVTTILRRSPTSVRTMLHRLGASARMGQDWFTKYTLAEALHVRAEEVQKWIDQGWLRIRQVGTHGVKKEIIDAEDFCQFCKEHREEIVGRRLNSDRLNFVQTFVFPPSHMELLPVRDAKKEQAAYEAQMKKESESEIVDEDDLEATA